MDLNKLINQVYEKHRIKVDPADPVFQILYLLIEQNFILDKERQKRVEAEVDEVIAAASAKLDNHVLAVKEANLATISDLLQKYDNLAELQSPNTNTKRKNFDISSWAFVVTAISSSLISILVTLLLLGS